MLWRLDMARKGQRVPEGIKARLLRQVFDGKMTEEEAAKEAGCTARAVRSWKNAIKSAALVTYLGDARSEASPPAAKPAPQPPPPPKPPAPAQKPPSPAPKPVEKPVPPKPAPPAPAPVEKKPEPPPRRRGDL